MSFVVPYHKQITIQQQKTTTKTTTTKTTTNYNNNKHSTNVMDKGCMSLVPCTRAWATFGKRHISTRGLNRHAMSFFTQDGFAMTT